MIACVFNSIAAAKTPARLELAILPCRLKSGTEFNFAITTSKSFANHEVMITAEHDGEDHRVGRTMKSIAVLRLIGDSFE